MKKTTLAIGIVAVLGIGYVGTAWYTGNIIENNIDSELKEINQKINDYQDKFKVAISYSKLEKNIFSTTFHLTVTLSPIDAYGTASQPRTLFDDDIIIHHGPFPMAALAKGTFLPQMAWIEYQLSEHTDPDLWKLLDNQPFISAYAGISYQNHLRVKVTNKALSATPDDLKYLDGLFVISEGDYSFESNVDFANIQANAHLDKLKYIENANNSLALDNLNISTKPNNNKTIVDFDVNVGHLNVQDGDYRYSHSPLETTVDNCKTQGSFNYKNHDLNVQNSIDKLIFKQISQQPTQPIEFNKLVLNQKNALNTSDTVDGIFQLNVESVIYGQQNLGYGTLDFAFQGLDKKLFSYDSEDDFYDDVNEIDMSNIKLSLNQFNWHNVVGDVNISADAKWVDMKEVPDTYGFEQIEKFNLKIDVPFDVVAYMFAQIEAAKKQENEISQAVIDEGIQSLENLCERFFSDAKFLTFKRNNISGIFSDVEYSKENIMIKVNGEKMLREELF